MENHDLLYSCFKKLLSSYPEANESEQDFISRVLEFFAEQVLMQGYIPAHQLEQMHIELEDELTHMLKKTIYGYWDLSHFRRKNFPQAI